MKQELKNLIEVVKSNREDLKKTYNSSMIFINDYGFQKKEEGTRYKPNVISEVRRFCFDKWQEGFKEKEIADMLGLKNQASVCNHIKKFCKSKIITS